ncbi:MAG TPA: class I SAM-dependent methyltransferase [Polyangiaceae bacterium]|nr:class I SAM-dependent methyltransferase [Polyangiaceae bacterium]
MSKSAIEKSYDEIAGPYADHFFDELRHKPLDRALLGMLAEEVGGTGPVLDVGCGPGQIARALRDRGPMVTGVDIAGGMIEIARRRSPDISFRVGSMLALEDGDATYAGLVAFYAIVHFTRDELDLACREFFRVLRPGGLALVSFHLGHGVLHRDELFEAKVDLDFVLFERETVEAALTGARLRIEAFVERAPYVAVEHPTQRGYVLARKPG